MAYVPNLGSVVAFQSQPSSLLVGASIIGNTPVNITHGRTSVFGTMSVIGTVPVTQATTPWIVGSVLLGSSNASVITVGGSTGNSSVQLLGGVAAIGSVAVLQGTNPWQINMPSPSVIAYQAAGSIMMVEGTFTTGNSSVQVVGTMPPQSVSGVGIFNVNHTGNGSIAVIGSVAVLQGTNPWTINNTSVLAFQGTLPWVIQSIVGTYAEDSAHTPLSAGLFTLGVRNDTMSSVTSTDGDYSQINVGPTGETIIANSPITAWWQANTSIMANVSVQAVAAAGASIFTYVTAVQVTNVSPNNAYITFTGGLGGKSSVLGYIPAPTNGGAIVTLPNAWKTGANMGVSASVSTYASVFLSMQGFTAKI